MLRHKHSLAPAAALPLPFGGAANLRAHVRAKNPERPAEPLNSVPNQRFDWADAGIGAGGAHGLAAVFLGAGLSMPNPRRRI